MVRDGRFQWATGIVFVLLLTALAVGWSHYKEIPPYRYLEEPQGRVSRYVRVALVGLILPTLGIFAFGLFKVRRYPLAG